MSVVYEVNLDLDAAIAADYRTWLDGHVREILALPGFTGAQVHEVLDPPAAVGRVALSVQYRLVDSDALDRYLREHATQPRGVLRRPLHGNAPGHARGAGMNG